MLIYLQNMGITKRNQLNIHEVSEFEINISVEDLVDELLTIWTQSFV